MRTFFAFCELPLQPVRGSCVRPANDPHYLRIGNVCSPQGSPDVRMLRKAYETDKTRFALTGKMRDVCQALETLAKQEHNRTRIAKS